MREAWIIGGATIAACLGGAGALFWAGPPRRLPSAEQPGRTPTLADARAFVERSFGAYLGGEGARRRAAQVAAAAAAKDGGVIEVGRR